jgi:1-acyl-sn-glycerol-3-phosphate acyltransferase
LTVKTDVGLSKVSHTSYFIFAIYCSLPAWNARQLSKLLGIKFEMRGLENIVQGSGCVVLINHQSALDILGEFSGLVLTCL